MTRSIDIIMGDLRAATLRLLGPYRHLTDEQIEALPELDPPKRKLLLSLRRAIREYDT